VIQAQLVSQSCRQLQQLQEIVCSSKGLSETLEGLLVKKQDTIQSLIVQSLQLTATSDTNSLAEQSANSRPDHLEQMIATLVPRTNDQPHTPTGSPSEDSPDAMTVENELRNSQREVPAYS
jgi:hypothetical protein